MQTPTQFDKPFPEPTDTGTKFADMTGPQKCVYVTKLVICVATFGFAFPHV